MVNRAFTLAPMQRPFATRCVASDTCQLRTSPQATLSLALHKHVARRPLVRPITEASCPVVSACSNNDESKFIEHCPGSGVKFE